MVIGLWLTLAFFCCGENRNPSQTAYKVTYRVDGQGTNTAHVLFTDSRDATVSDNVDLPWTQSFEAEGGRLLLLSARNTGGVSASVTAAIIVNGKIVDDKTAGGRIDTAEVTYRCPW